MNHRLLAPLLAAIFSFLACGAARAASPIPVYPGSVLDIEASAEPECCDFSTADSLARVSAFYEKALKSEPLTIEQATASYPALSQTLATLKKMIPAGVTYRAFALPGEDGTVGRTPQFFELLGAAGLVNYTIPVEALSPEDADYAAEFRARTGRLNEEEKAAAQRKEEEKLARANSAREDALWRKAVGSQGLAIFPDAVYHRTQLPEGTEAGVEGGAAQDAPLLGIYESYSLFEKIKDFYGARLSQVSEETISGRRAVSPFRYAEGGAGRSYTSKSRAGQTRAYYAGGGCVDVAVIEGRGGESGQRIATIVFDFNPGCSEAKALAEALKAP